MSQSRRGTRSRQAPSTDASDDESKSVTDSTDQDQEESGESNASVASPPPPPATFNYIINDSRAQKFAALTLLLQAIALEAELALTSRLFVW